MLKRRLLCRVLGEFFFWCVCLMLIWLVRAGGEVTAMGDLGDLIRVVERLGGD